MTGDITSEAVLAHVEGVLERMDMLSRLGVGIEVTTDGLVRVFEKRQKAEGRRQNEEKAKAKNLEGVK